MPSEWTVDSLKAYVDALLAAQRELMVNQNNCINERITSQGQVMEAQDQANERVMEDIHSDFRHIQYAMPKLLTREDYEPRHAQLEQRIAELSSRQDRSEGLRAGKSDLVARAIAASAALAAVVSVIIILIFHH